MSSHRRRFATVRSTRVRAALCLGMLVALGWTSTTAFWTDTATMTGGTFTSGTLDVGLDGNLAGQGGTWANTQLQLANMVPGESVADAFAVQNVGTTPLVYRATAVAAGALAPNLRFSVSTGSTASNTTDGSGNRVGTCVGGTVEIADATLSSVPVAVVATDQLIGVGGSQSMCVQVTLITTAPNSAQGLSATTTFTFNARQPGSPP
jgi:predicted ribosomally synthesized peptide with SipW-like signal peptide